MRVMPIRLTQAAASVTAYRRQQTPLGLVACALTAPRAPVLADEQRRQAAKALCPEYFQYTATNRTERTG